MKKQLLCTALLFSTVSQAQSLDQSNEPIIGENATMFVCDTLTDPYSTTTGGAVTWDYSNLLGLNNGTRVIEIIDPTTTPNAASFPTSTKAFAIQGSLTNYFNSSALERVSQGFVYEEPSMGTVIAVFNTDEQVMIQYPFAYPDYFMDNFSGSLEFTFNGLPQNPTCTGVSYASIDGQGTLLLPNSTSIPNVIRYKIIDTVFTQVVFVVPMDIEFVHTQYEYYDPTASSLPLFIHTTVLIEQQGATTPLLTNTIVLSSVQPTENVGIETVSTTEFSVYPNPSEGIINFKGVFDSNASATIYDQSGRIVASIATLTNGQTTDLSHLNKGMYLVVVNNNGTQTTNSIVLR